MRRLFYGLAASILCGVAMCPALAQTPVTVTAVRNFPPIVYEAGRQNWAIAEDDRGILYFGNTAGVLEFDGTRWRLIQLPGGRGAYALCKAADGRILVGGEGEAGWLAPDQSGSMMYVSKVAGLSETFRRSGERVVQILDTPGGEVVLSDHFLLVKAVGGALTEVRSQDHFLQAAWFHSALYVLDSAQGLMRLEGGALQNVAGGAQRQGLTMLVTDAGLLIPSYIDGLVLYAPDAASPWRVLNAAGWSPADSADVTSAVVLNQDLLAFGTAKHGVTLTNAAGEVLQRIGAAQDLADDHVYSVHYDQRGGLWLALDNGLSLVGLNLPKDGTAVPFRSWVRSVAGTRDERLLFGGAFSASQGGIQQLLQSLAQKFEFPYNYNAFRFSYSANGLEASGVMQFQTYMQGVDTGWTGWSTRTVREFTQLGAGRWIFRVRSLKPDGEISGEGVYELVIRPAWYDTWWFTVFQVFFVLGLLLLPGHTHQYKGLQDALTTLAVIVPFVYVGDWLSDLIGHYYSTDVGFIKMLMSALLAFALDPMQTLLKKSVEHRNARRKARHLARRAGHSSNAGTGKS